ncbi:MAG: Urease accessory protein UreD [Polaromonas sp.]|nr:Urease accessory protein UreD [Polaromonas sp.]
MSWNATLNIDYTRAAGKTIARFRHDGPLRILQSLYPEGDATCHNVIVHPPGGLVGGDTLEVNITAAEGAHGLVTTPGATRFYRSDGDTALQNTTLKLEAAARMEWLPLEAICYSGCIAHNRLRMVLAPGAELLGWDLTALGLPAAGKPFVRGSYEQHIEVPGVWLERGRILATDTLLMESPLGLAGHRCLGTLFFVAGTRIERQRRELALDIAREIMEAHELHTSAGATSPDGRILLVRVLSPMAEPAMGLLRQVWLAWRQHLWQQGSSSPRIWAT